MNQNRQVLEWMQKNSSISDIQAYEFLGVRRLAARIHQLREQGYDIDTINCSEFSKRTGKLITFARYRLKEKACQI